MTSPQKALRRLAAALVLSSALTLAAAAIAGTAQARGATQAALDAFFSSEYNYCDAKLVAALWSIDITRAKAEIGIKILNGYPENIPGVLAEARDVAACDFWDTSLTYEDAEYLAGIWGVSIDGAKAKVGAYYTAGRSDIVLGALS